jgi:hypothetical protein
MEKLLGCSVEQGLATYPATFATEASKRLANGQAEIWDVDASLLNLNSNFLMGVSNGARTQDPFLISGFSESKTTVQRSFF